MKDHTGHFEPQFEARFAANAAEVEACLKLRYEVFVAELGGDGEGVDRSRLTESDHFDSFCDHILLLDHSKAGEAVIGTYRVMSAPQAANAGGFYTAGEFDLSKLNGSGLKPLELGRSCLRKDYRGGLGTLYLWQALAKYIEDNEIEILFGVASFHGQKPQNFDHALSFLFYKRQADPQVCPVSLSYTPMNILPPELVDRTKAMQQMPALIKAYLRLGCGVGDGAFIDRHFNTVDICIVSDATQITSRARSIYARGIG